ncbi:dNA/RNA helicase, superfamily II [Mycobacterium xenopi 3993]|nr:dNA/RNA helicase, superfamily II [Mycobacterium xenopi 3993]
MAVVGDLAQDAFDVGQKPRSSISSASSSTSTDSLPSRRCPCWARSRSRPGVPTTTSAPARSAWICGSYGRPP